ncbi:hypothetical protein BDY21DRAFT_367285 [Lineolata rhizophorae]|uniref:Uncharacterized protein n=1 Tax=Lineolata rhizophorae TaxID=578093 RepID=A0A6A6NMS7_9PEZI|nr:hypothetical protein BDY21DRAFT_367285 [Lineolata rhizophorae]
MAPSASKKSAIWKVSVAIYRPHSGNHMHWAPHLHGGDDHHIFEVVGEQPAFVRNDMEVDPKNTIRLEMDIELTKISENNVEEFKRVVRKTKVDDDTVHWNCQDYVLEALENLEMECIVDEDVDYQVAKTILKGELGPMV